MPHGTYVLSLPPLLLVEHLTFNQGVTGFSGVTGRRSNQLSYSYEEIGGVDPVGGATKSGAQGLGTIPDESVSPAEGAIPAEFTQ
jgi:hypothetical protein